MWQNYPAMHAKRKAHILAGNFGKRTALIGWHQIDLWKKNV